jgi:hypothetical protein
MYHAIFENGTVISKNTFEEAKAIPYANYVVKAVNLAASGSRYSRYKYEIMDSIGNPINLNIGDFELIDIGNTITGWNYDYLELTFFDKKNSVPFTIRSDGGFIGNFYTAVVNFMKMLNELGSYKAYQNKLRIEELENQLESSKKQIESKNNEIKELREELRNLKDIKS